MPHLRLKIEIIDSTKPTELFITAQPTGETISIVQVSVMNDEGKFERAATINKALLEHLRNIKIELPVVNKSK